MGSATDRAGFRDWLADALAELEPEELIVDSFPGGILGELCGMELPPARHVARRLRWPAYALRLDGPLPRYEVVYELEPLEERHAQELATGRIEPLTLPLANGPARRSRTSRIGSSSIRGRTRRSSNWPSVPPTCGPTGR